MGQPADDKPTLAHEAPYPGSHKMPRWDTGELSEPPVFRWKQILLMIGPGLVMGAAAVGGGEWLLGPLVTARYGGALLWLATLSIVGQVIYNIEISRYALYTGEPIFAGKFRLLPGPGFWMMAYLVLDFGSFLPYLVSNAAIPAAGMWLGRLPTNSAPDQFVVSVMKQFIFVGMLTPLFFGGKVYHSLKFVTMVKLIVVMGFLMFLAIFYSTWDTWRELGTGFFRFGTLPLVPEVEAGAPRMVNIPLAWWNGQPLSELFSQLDLTMLALITAMAAIAGNGGLTNTPISNFTRDQGWGMGKEVGAIPSMIGGHSIELSHVGKVFLLTPESLRRWRGWVAHVRRDQLCVWLPACFIGMALPSMLSVQFLPPGLELKPDEQWLAAGMTAQGVSDAVAPTLGVTIGKFFWGLTLFCGFITLATSAVITADGVLRRWIDVIWIASPKVRTLDPEQIRYVYFGTLLVYMVLGLLMLNVQEPTQLVKVSTTIYNFALGFSCFHVVAVNLVLLPKEIRPGWLLSGMLVAAGAYFSCIAGITTLNALGFFAR